MLTRFSKFMLKKYFRAFKNLTVVLRAFKIVGIRLGISIQILFRPPPPMPCRLYTFSMLLVHVLSTLILENLWLHPLQRDGYLTGGMYAIWLYQPFLAPFVCHHGMGQAREACWRNWPANMRQQKGGIFRMLCPMNIPWNIVYRTVQLYLRIQME